MRTTIMYKAFYFGTHSVKQARDMSNPESVCVWIWKYSHNFGNSMKKIFMINQTKNMFLRSYKNSREYC